MWTLNNTITGEVIFHTNGSSFKTKPILQPIFYNYSGEGLPPADTVWSEFETPCDIDIRRFDNVTIYPSRVLTQKEYILRPTFFKHPNHFHGGVRKNEMGTYQLRSNQNLVTKPAEKLHSAIYADTPYPKVFGHVLLEVIPSFWAADFIDKDIPIATSVDVKKYAAWFARWGLTEKNFYQIKSGIDIEHLYVPTPTVLLRRYVHPIAKNYLRRAIQSVYLNSEYGEKIYVSRLNIDERRLVNELEIIKIFESYGFKIFFPEKHTPQEQITVFKNARYIAGAAGSAMHNLIFSNPETKVLILASSGWLVVADSLVTSHFDSPLGYVLGHPLNFDGINHQRTQDNWEIDANSVKMAIEKHFLL